MDTQFSYYRPLDMSPKFEIRWVHERHFATHPIVVPAQQTMKQIWRIVLDHARRSQTQIHILQQPLERVFFLQETSDTRAFRNLPFAKVVWNDTRGFSIWLERSIVRGCKLRIEVHTTPVNEEELLDGTAAPKERVDHWKPLKYFTAYDKEYADEEEQGGHPRSNGRTGDDDDEMDDDDDDSDEEGVQAPATLVFFPKRLNGKTADEDDEEPRGRRARGDEDGLGELVEHMGRIGEDEVQFELNPGSLAFRPRGR